jgi:hypothetical protein
MVNPQQKRVTGFNPGSLGKRIIGPGQKKEKGGTADRFPRGFRVGCFSLPGTPEFSFFPFPFRSGNRL